jgi:hypothetical protein
MKGDLVSSDLDLPYERRASALADITAMLRYIDKANEASLAERRACRCGAHGIPSSVSTLALSLKATLGWDEE